MGGCTASKLDNEDTVRRCKERRRLIKQAVYARHSLAAAQSDYCRSLRITASALSDFASGEPLSVSDQTPPAVLPSSFSVPKRFDSSTTTPTVRSRSRSVGRTQSFYSQSSAPAPAPPPPLYESVRSERELKPTHMRSASSVSASTTASSMMNDRFRKRDGKPVPKLPHILSESSVASSPRRTKSSNFRDGYYPTAAAYDVSTPSQTSSVWNWENFYPPSPPGSEYFDRKEREKLDREKMEHQKLEREKMEHEKLEHEKSKFRSIHQSSSDEDDEEEELQQQTEKEDFDNLREEVHCSEWGDHYSTTSSSDADGPVENLNDDDDDDDDIESRSEMESRSNFGSSVRSEFVPQMRNKYQAKSMKSEDDGVSSLNYGDMRIVVRHKNLAEIVAAIREHFDKAAEAGEKVSDMLEIGRAQLDKSFRQLTKTVYHSSGLFSNLSSSWTSKPPLAIKYRLDASALNEPGGSKSLCSTLERLLAWEKKLCEEVKSRESVKIEHERKLSTLQNQEYKSEDEVKLDKTKAAITRLQSLIIVTSQAVSTTSTAIIGLRDSDLVPQLVELCHGLMYMWRSMNQHHEIQNQIVQQVKGLIHQASKGDSTSELHRQATRELESAVSSWHLSFCRVIKFQRDFIQSLYGWYKLTLIPLNTDNIPADGHNKEHSDVFSFLDEWKLSLERLPDTVASEAIKSFVNVVHVISSKQSEELKIKKRTESVAKELEKKASSLRSIEKKYYNSFSMIGLGVPDSDPNNPNNILDARDPLSDKKSELAICRRRVEDEMVKHLKAVEVTRAMTLNNLQTGLPGVFQAMSSFSALFMEAMESVCTRSYAIK